MITQVAIFEASVNQIYMLKTILTGGGKHGVTGEDRIRAGHKA